MKEKIVIYQVLPRLFGNRNTTRKENGSIEENGCGKLNNFSDEVLARIHDMGFTHIWFTGVIRHATQTNYSSYGIPTQHAEVVKGKAGSPYAITDYYDIDPDLAVNVSLRMKEWETLIERTHKAGMKVIMDFVPNHVAREYHSICKPAGVRDLGDEADLAAGREAHLAGIVVQLAGQDLEQRRLARAEKTGVNINFCHTKTPSVLFFTVVKYSTSVKWYQADF